MDFLPDPFFESFHVFKQFPSNLKLVPFFDCGLEVSKLAKVVEVLPGQPDKTCPHARSGLEVQPLLHVEGGSCTELPSEGG